MPRIVRTSGVRLTDDVVRIRDLAPTPMPKAPPKTPEEEQREIEADFRPEFDEETAGEGPAGAGVAPDTAAGDGAVEDAEFEELAPEEKAPEPLTAQSAVEPADFAAQAAVAPPPAPAAPPLPDITEEMIQSAMTEASRILEDAVRQAEDQKAEALAGVQQQAEQLRAEAAEAGRLQGLEAATEEMEKLSAQLVDAIGRFEGSRAAFEAEYEDQLKWMSLEIAGKVLAKKVSEDDAVLTEMVDKAVQSVRSEPWVRVDVAQEMTGLLDSLTKLYDERANIQVGAIPAGPGTVQIETPSGLVDASLRTQLQNLREYFAQNSAGGEIAAGAAPEQ